MTGRERIDIVIGGHVDHGKSTIIGRLLADTHSLPEGKLDQVRELCRRTSKPFEYTFLLDALKDERAQGITIDAARVFFKTPKRDYILIDAPGHVEFVRNLVTGAARAQAALLVIDVVEGVRENSRRHGHLMAMLGIRQLAVLVNKMDLVGYDQGRFGEVEAEYRDFLANLQVHPTAFVPVSGREGNNIAARSAAMPWYAGPTVLELVDTFSNERPDEKKPFRLPVQDVYKFTGLGDDRRIIAGTVESGSAACGDELVFYPSGKRGVIRSVEGFHTAPRTSVAAGEAVGLTLEEQIYIGRGEVATLARDPRPHVSSRLRVSLFWLGKAPLVRDKDYTLKIGTARMPVRLEAVHRAIDSSDLSTTERKDRVDRHDVAECTLAADRGIAFDLAEDIPATGRFVLVDDYDISGGGIVREALPDRQTWVREKIQLRNYKWEPSFIPADRRAARFGQRATLLLVTGPRSTDRKGLAKKLESRLFDEGRAAYFLGMGNILYGVDADIARDPEHRREHLRRLAEVANVMLDAGLILIVSAAELTLEDLELIKTTVDLGQVEAVWIGGTSGTDFRHDLHVVEHEDEDEAVDRIVALLHGTGVIVRPEPAVIWFTGLSGAGKSTIADWVIGHLRESGVRVEPLDGDSVRQIFPTTGFTKAERDTHIRRVGYLASRLEQHGVSVVASFVSPYRESRDFVRGLCQNFLEIYVSTPLEVCERRDVKGFYARARRGEVRNFTGIDDPYEPPVNPDLVIDSTNLPVEQAGRMVVDLIRRRSVD